MSFACIGLFTFFSPLDLSRIRFQPTLEKPGFSKELRTLYGHMFSQSYHSLQDLAGAHMFCIMLFIFVARTFHVAILRVWNLPVKISLCQLFKSSS